MVRVWHVLSCPWSGISHKHVQFAHTHRKTANVLEHITHGYNVTIIGTFAIFSFVVFNVTFDLYECPTLMQRHASLSL